MKHLTRAAAAAFLLTTVGACTSSSGSTDATSTPEPYDAATATDEEKWAHFEGLATDAGVDPKNYPATVDEAGEAAEALCSRTEEDVTNIDALMESMVGEAQYELEKEAEFFFLEAYCPELIPVFEAGHAAPPPKPKG